MILPRPSHNKNFNLMTSRINVIYCLKNISNSFFIMTFPTIELRLLQPLKIIILFNPIQIPLLNMVNNFRSGISITLMIKEVINPELNVF